MSAIPLQLALVGPLPPPSGGMANQTEQLARLLRQEGVTVELVQVNAPYTPAWVADMRGLRALFRLLPYLLRLWRAAGRAEVFHVMANSGWSWHLYVVPAVWIAVLRGVPVVINYRGGGAEEFFDRSMRWLRPTLRAASIVVVPSGFLLKVFHRRGFAPRVVANIIDLARFSRRELAPVPNQRPCLIVTRNLDRIYDIETALHAFAAVQTRYPGATLSIAGSGPEQSRLEALTRELGLSDAVAFTGRLDNAAMAALYQRADVMINPSRVDNMPISILEALASGVPVVSTNVGGIPHLVEHERSALLVDPGRLEALAGAIVRLLQDSALAARLIEAGLAQVQQYAWQRVRAQWLRVYNEARGQRSAQPEEQLSRR